MSTMTDLAIRPFHVQIPDEDPVDLCRRIVAIRCPDEKTVINHS